jgi:hypothetical protein
VRSLGNGAAWEARAGAAPKPGTTESHGVFALRNSSKSGAEFLVLLDVGCKRPAVTISTSGSVRTVSVGGQSVTLN